MTPKSWKYVITNHCGPSIRIVDERDREWAEKEWKVIDSFSATHRNHSLNVRCFAVLLNEFWSGFGGHRHNYKERR